MAEDNKLSRSVLSIQGANTILGSSSAIKEIIKEMVYVAARPKAGVNQFAIDP